MIFVYFWARSAWLADLGRFQHAAVIATERIAQHRSGFAPPPGAFELDP
jgi:hypothetical protein